MNRVPVRPEMLRWARERVRIAPDALGKAFPRFREWEAGEVKPTLKQLERFARATRVPVGYLFLTKPPTERVPIPDLRTMPGARASRPSPDLLDAIYLCQNRQAWYRDWARSAGERPLAFVGSARLDSPVEKTAAQMRSAVRFDLEARRTCPTWTDALRGFIAKVDEAGVLVMVSGVVGSNTRRKLDPEEFRGFAISDTVAPLVFINGADSKSAQMFTLAHELAHLWLGESALTDVGPASAPTQRIESWCNRVAAEMLVPLNVLRRELSPGDVLQDVPQLARRFKVSRLVILRRLLDARRLSRETFDEAYGSELASLREMPKSSGGDFYLTQPARLGRRLARALVVSALEGQTSFTEVFRLLGVKKMATFDELRRSLKVGF